MVELPCVTIFFLTNTVALALAHGPAGRPGSRQSGRWPHPAGLGHQKSRPTVSKARGLPEDRPDY